MLHRSFPIILEGNSSSELVRTEYDRPATADATPNSVTRSSTPTAPAEACGFPCEQQYYVTDYSRGAVCSLRRQGVPPRLEVEVPAPAEDRPVRVAGGAAHTPVQPTPLLETAQKSAESFEQPVRVSGGVR